MTSSNLTPRLVRYNNIVKSFGTPEFACPLENNYGLGPGQPQTIRSGFKANLKSDNPELAAIVTAIELGMNVSQAIGF